MDPSPETEGRDPGRPPPLQFHLRTLLAITLVFSLIFAALRWLETPPRVGYILLAVLAVSVLAALALLVVIAGTSAGDDE